MTNQISGCTVSNAVSSLGIEDFVVYGDPKNEEEFNSMFKKVVGIDSTNSTILSSDPSDFGVTWSQVEAKKLELEAAEPMRLLREERDQLLSQSDWRDLPSYPGSNQEAWRTYRQQLRDLPSTTDPSNPTWPTAPEND